MSYAISWVGDKQILYCRLWDSLRVGELRVANADLDALLVAAHEPVHLIFHATDIDHRLPSINAMRGPLNTHGRDRIHWTVFVGGNAALRFIGLVIVSSLGLRAHSSPDMYEAADFLTATDPALPDSVLTDLRHLASLAPGQLPVLHQS